MSDKVNVLCLHGCTQHAAMCQRLMKYYIKIGEKDDNIKYHWIEAMYDHPDGGKTWYAKPLVVSNIGKIEYDTELQEAATDALKAIHDYVEANNITVLMGFSQGGNAVDLYMSVYQNPRIKRIVVMSGYSLVGYDRTVPQIPCLNVCSDIDTIVPSKLIVNGYGKQYILKHEKGHKTPTRKPIIRAICKFMGSGVFDYSAE